MSVKIEQVDRDAARVFTECVDLGSPDAIEEALAKFSSLARRTGHKEAATVVMAYQATFSDELVYPRAGLQAIMHLLDPDIPAPDLKLNIPGKVWSAKG